MRLRVLVIVACVLLAPAYRLSSDSAAALDAIGQRGERGSTEPRTLASPECFSLSCGLTPDDTAGITPSLARLAL